MDELSGKPHPLPTPLPQSLSRKCAFGSTHTLSVHIIPAAYPRAGSPSGRVEIPGLDAFQGKSTKEDRKQWLKEPMGHMFWEKKEAERVFPGPKVNIRVAEEDICGTRLRIRRNRSATDDGIQIFKGRRGLL
jgi:hypothetical protein